LAKASPISLEHFSRPTALNISYGVKFAQYGLLAYDKRQTLKTIFQC